MNDSKIAFDYIRESSTLASVSNEQNQPLGTITRSILNFLKSHPDSSYYNRIYRKLKVELTKLFILSHTTAKKFAEQYGLGELQFIRIVGEVIDDPTIVTSDALADKIYRMLLHNRNSLGLLTPKRNVCIIARLYAYSQEISQSSIAYFYNISRCSIAAILKRGITEGILSKDLAEKVACKACYKQSKYITSGYANSCYNK